MFFCRGSWRRCLKFSDSTLCGDCSLIIHCLKATADLRLSDQSTVPMTLHLWTQIRISSDFFFLSWDIPLLLNVKSVHSCYHRNRRQLGVAHQSPCFSWPPHKLGWWVEFWEREETFNKLNTTLINIFDQVSDYLILSFLADVKSWEHVVKWYVFICAWVYLNFIAKF